MCEVGGLGIGEVDGAKSRREGFGGAFVVVVVVE